MQQRMKHYNYRKLGELDEYGQPTTQPTIYDILMFVSLTNDKDRDNPLYRESSYVGITHDKNINDECVVTIDSFDYKVQYVVHGRFNQVFLKRCS